MDLAWHAARFRFEWPEGAEPAWHRDLMLAHRVVGPVLAARQDRIPLWRFHRRAVRDATGHQFSFIFYADVATATEIMDALRTDALLATLQNKGIVTSIHFSDPRKSQQPAVADTADKQWSPAVQRTWPYFIMGASRMWLGLIEAAASGKDKDLSMNYNGLDALYRQADAEVTAAWRREGRHALLHHLNALFGYEPLEVWEMNLMRF